MTQDEIIRFAIQCRLVTTGNCDGLYMDALTEFAKLAVAKALAQEKALQALHSENERLGLYKDAYAEQEPVKIAHRHEWFRTGEMKVGQMRCISCGTWGQEDMPQRTWVGLTDDEIFALSKGHIVRSTYAKAIEAKLKEKNCVG